jgi:hypothetical protein
MKRVLLVIVATLCCLGVAWAGAPKPLPPMSTVYSVDIPQKSDGGICVTFTATDINHKKILIKSGTIAGLAPGAPEWQKQAAMDTWAQAARNEYNAKLAAGSIEKQRTTELWCEGARQNKKSGAESCGGGDCYLRAYPGKENLQLTDCLMCVCPRDCTALVLCCPGGTACPYLCPGCN